MTPAQLSALATVHARVNGDSKAQPAPAPKTVGTPGDWLAFAAMPRR